CHREGGCAKADRLGDDEGHGSADPSGPQRALALFCTDARPDDCYQRRAEAEDERHQQIFEPRAGAVAGYRGRAELADERGTNDDGEVRRTSDKRGDRPEAEYVEKERPAESHSAQRRMQRAASAPEVRAKHKAADGVVRQERHGTACDAEGWKRSPAE